MTNVSSTLIPSTIALSFEDKEELHEIEQKYKAILNNTKRKFKGEAFYQFVFSLKLKKTNNIGIHYFCLQHDVALKDLAANPNISTDIALLLFTKLEYGIAPTMIGLVCKELLSKFESNVVPIMLASTIYKELLLNPVLYDNLDIFETIINRTINNNQNLLVIVIGGLETAPINILMFLLSHSVTSPFSKFYAELVTARSNEILAWVGLHNPKLKDVPFSWVMRAYGFTNGVFDD